MSWTTNDAGRKGGNARAAKLSKDRLAEIARKAGKASGKARRKLRLKPKANDKICTAFSENKD